MTLDVGTTLENQLVFLAEQLVKWTAFFLESKQTTLTSMQQEDGETIYQSSLELQESIRRLPHQLSAKTTDELKDIRHDLRNHLNVILGFGHVLIQGISGHLPPMKFDVMCRIYTYGEALLKLVNQIS